MRVVYLSLALLFSGLLYGAEVNTSNTNVFYRGTGEVAGSITVGIDSDDFSNASESHVVIEVSLSNNAVLATTLVEPVAPGGHQVLVPINIPLVGSLNNGVTVTANVDAVRIVRYIAGESTIWVQITQSSSEWLNIGAPGGDNTVNFKLGLSRLVYSQATYDDGKANLPFPTRSSVEPFVAEDTFICMDLSESTITSTGSTDSRVSVDLRATVGSNVSTGVTGDNLGVGFDSGDIATGRDRSCELDVLWGYNDVTTPLCNDRGSDNNVVSIANTYTVSMECDSGVLLQTSFGPGSYLRFTASGDYGFDTSGVGFVNTGAPNEVTFSSANTTGVEGTEFTVTNADEEDVVLFRSVDLTYTGEDSFTNPTFSFVLPVHMDRRNSEVDVSVSWTTHVSTENSSRCGSGSYVMFPDDLNVGSFVNCVGTTNVLEFQYTPKVGGDFWIGLGITNFSYTNVEVFAEFIAGGNKTVLPLGTHGSNSVNTWVFTSLEGKPTLYSNDLGRVLLFDDTLDLSGNNSAFRLYGTFVAQYTDELDNDNLNGYMIIGNDSGIQGAYTPTLRD